MATGMFENDTPGNCLQQQQQQPPGVPDSPDSIPLPESPPPEAEVRVALQEPMLRQQPDPTMREDLIPVPNPNNNIPNFNLSTGSVSTSNMSKGSTKRKCTAPRHTEEYDPSEPLTSSDEDESEIQLDERETPNSKKDTHMGNIKNPSRSSNGSTRSSSAVELSRNTSPNPNRLETSPPSSETSKSSSSNGKLVSPKLAQEPKTNSKSLNNESSKSGNGSSQVDLSTISVPTDESRRPTIQFAIPSRHRLLPMSNLIKLQKGSPRKTGEGIFLLDETCKGFSKTLGGVDDEEDSGENRPKLPKLSDIFRNENEEEEGEIGDETEQESQSMSEGGGLLHSESGGVGAQNILSDTYTQQAIDKGNTGRWKLVAEEPIISISKSIMEPESASPEPLTEQDMEGNTLLEHPLTSSSSQGVQDEQSTAVVPEDEPEIIEIVTINVPPPLNRMRSMRRRPLFGRLGFENGGVPEVIDIDIDKDEDEEHARTTNTTTNAPATTPTLNSVSTSTPPRRSSSARDIFNESEREKERERERDTRDRLRSSRFSDSSPERERHFKRPHSTSSSNCEEGEIVDQVNPKKRKKERKKKSKRRRRSKDSVSPQPKSSSDKRLSDTTPHVSSDHEESTGGRGAISWRKPSKRTQNRNYRDGKPKADDSLFQKETEEKARSISPSHRRNRNRKEKSPAKEKSGGKHRRENSPQNRSHSKSPGRTSRSRSSSGRPYRSRRRNRQSRSRSSNSLSDKSRSARSTSRKRSRRRYRRSTSRQHVGDSRSPSYITEPIRSRSSHYSKLRDRSRSRSRDRHARARYRKRSVSRSQSPSPLPRGHKKSKKPESVDRQQKRNKVKEKEKQGEDSMSSDAKEKKKEKEKLKEKEKRKKKEKPKEEEKVKPKEKAKEKEKKKKRKRREKSPTPVKAIVADGDSIVVSLSFQKGKTASSSGNTQTSTVADEHKENGLDTSTSSESSGKQSTKANGDGDPSVDLEEVESADVDSPAKLSSVTDDEDTTPPSVPSPTEESIPNDEKETEAVKVTSSGGGGASCSSNSPFEGERSFSAAADSTKIATPQPSEPHEATFGQSTTVTADQETAVQGDSVVTSTGDSIEQPAAAAVAVVTGEEDSSKSTTTLVATVTTPTSKPEVSKLLFPPLLGNKITISQISPRVPSTQTSGSIASATVTTDSIASLSSVPPATTSAAGSSGVVTLAQTPVIPVVSRPLIGNIPGLYSSNATVTSAGSSLIPPPIVIPTPPVPQGLRFPNVSAPLLNPNVLASVANALFAVRQTTPTLKLPGPSGISNVDNSSSQLRHLSTLPRNPNFLVQTNIRNTSGNSFTAQDQGAGESPMSPNSSDGDDLFEPPTERTQTDGGANGTAKLKNIHLFTNASIHQATLSDPFNPSGTNKAKGTNSFFESLFGTIDHKKIIPTPAKPEKITKPPVLIPKPKPRKEDAPKPPFVPPAAAAPRRETIKVNTSGGLTEGELRLTDEVPTSAVELIVKQKYLKKLNRQERVVEEVKLSLKPHYSKRYINKAEYKEILRKAVPKVCHNKTGEINPGKIKELVEAYVKKFRHTRKRESASNAK